MTTFQIWEVAMSDESYVKWQSISTVAIAYTIGSFWKHFEEIRVTRIDEHRMKAIQARWSIRGDDN